MFVLSVFCLICGIIHQQLQCCSAMSDETVAVQLAFLTEKYLQLDHKFTQLDKKYEDLSRENLNLKTRIEDLDKENRNIKDQLQSESTQINYQLQSEGKRINSQLQSKSKEINSHHRDDYTNKETNINTAEKDHSYKVEEIEHEKEEYFESHPDLVTMADVVKTNSDLKEATTNKMNENPRDGIYKKKRLLIDSVTTPPPDVPRIAFYAILTHDLSLGQHQTVEYDKVVTNVGNAYNSRHGHFISPVKGVYLMSFTLMNKNGGDMEIEMVRNGVRVAHGYGDSTGYNMGTQVAIVILEKDDMVWVRHAPSSTEVLHRAEYNTFAGTLLFTV